MLIILILIIKICYKEQWIYYKYLTMNIKINNKILFKLQILIHY